MADTVSLLTTSVHSGGTQTLQGEKAKGDAYFGQSDGLHTVMIELNEFIGTVKIQGSLETTPGDNDWFDLELGLDGFSVTLLARLQVCQLKVYLIQMQRQVKKPTIAEVTLFG